MRHWCLGDKSLQPFLRIGYIDIDDYGIVSDPALVASGFSETTVHHRLKLLLMRVGVEVLSQLHVSTQQELGQWISTGMWKEFWSNGVAIIEDLESTGQLTCGACSNYLQADVLQCELCTRNYCSKCASVCDACNKIVCFKCEAIT